MQEKSNKNTEIAARINKVIVNEGIKPNTFAKKLGYERSQTIYDIISSKSAPSFDFFSKFESSGFSEKYNISWLISGKGEMLKAKKEYIYDLANSSIAENSKHFLSEKEINSSGRSLPLFDIRTGYEFKALFTGGNQHILDTIYIPNISKVDGAMYIAGDSMYPLLQSGDIIVFRKINNLEYLIPGEIYVLSYEIDGDEHCVIKYVNKSEKDGFFRLVSYNENHQSIDIPIPSVVAIAIVKASIRYNTME